MDTTKWADFYLGRIFQIKKGKRLTKENMMPGDLNFLGAIQGMNGVREKINEEPQVWLQHFISCLFHPLRAFHQTPCVHKRNQKQTYTPL